MRLKKCLYIIDVQNGFISDRTNFVIERIEKLLKDNIFDIVIATKFINKQDSPYRKFLNWHRLSDTNETNLNGSVEAGCDYIIEKDIYTAVNQKTKEIMTKNEITQAFLLGIDTDCCVLKTAVDLFEIGVHPIVLEHYSASNGGNDSHKAAIKVLERFIGKNNIICSEINKEIVENIINK